MVADGDMVLSSKSHKAKESTTKQHPKIKGCGTLYVVATPIGNLEDITLRALRILQEVSLIAAEDTRQTRKLLSHFAIHTSLISYYQGNETSRVAKIIKRLQGGDDVALVSDAGTPGISDPGSILLKQLLHLGLPVVPIPGPSALTATISVAGFPSNPFIFLGFLPPRANRRQTLLKSLVREPFNLLFYEAPHRIKKSLEDCLMVLGDRRLFMARELTKIHEELVSDSISATLTILGQRAKIKGEIVIMIEGLRTTKQPSTEQINNMLHRLHDHSTISLRDAVKQVVTDLQTARSPVYQEALKIWKGEYRKGE